MGAGGLMKKNRYRLLSVILGLIATIGSFFISYYSLTELNNQFTFIFTFIALVISLFGIITIFVLTKEEK